MYPHSPWLMGRILHLKKYAQNTLKFSALRRIRALLFLPDDVHLIVEQKSSYDYKADIPSQRPDISDAG